MKNSARWEVEPWKSFQFGLNKAHYFRYQYEPTDVGTAGRFTVWVHCGQTLSTYTVRATVNNNTGEVEVTNMIVTEALVSSEGWNRVRGSLRVLNLRPI